MFYILVIIIHFFYYNLLSERVFLKFNNLKTISFAEVDEMTRSFYWNRDVKMSVVSLSRDRDRVRDLEKDFDKLFGVPQSTLYVVVDYQSVFHEMISKQNSTLFTTNSWLFIYTFDFG
jgi:hypothetical protein